MKQLSRKYATRWLFNVQTSTIFFLGCLLGIVTFLCLYGPNVVNFRNDAWLLNGEDLNQHYIGWRYFRDTPWTFPIGLTDGLIYPFKISVLYTDSIPIAAIFFKIFSPLLPATFQYFGIWGLLTFALQGGSACLLVRKFTGNALLCLIAAVFFVISPILMQRMFVHTSLASQWLIIFSLCAWLYGIDCQWSAKKNVLLWSLLLILGALIHPYYTPLIYGILCGFLLHKFITGYNWTAFFSTLIIPIISLILAMWIIGAFYGESVNTIFGLGFYSANLNAPINPLDSSAFIKTLPLATQGQGEGYSYLGLGLLLLLPIALACPHFKYGSTDNQEIYPEKTADAKSRLFTVQNIIKSKAFGISSGIVIVVFFVLALSPVVTLNDKVIVTIHYPEFIMSILQIFRASGRFMFPILYFLTAFSCISIILHFKPLRAFAILCIAVILQISDLHGKMQALRQFGDMKPENVQALKSNAWNEIAANSREIIFLTKDIHTISGFFELMNFATSNHLVTNNSYTARPDKRVFDTVDKQFAAIAKGELNDNVIYVLDNSMPPSIQLSRLSLYKIDGHLIGLTKPLRGSNYSNLETVESSRYTIAMNNDSCLINGKYDEHGRMLHENGISFGPYIPLSSGGYRVVISGKFLNYAEFDAYSDRLKTKFPIQIEKQESDVIIFNFELSQNIDDAEFRVFNHNNNKIIEIYKIEINAK